MNTSYLSNKQIEIISTADGALLVKASAGSGKTRVLTERIKVLLQKTKRNILAITFTNKAGEEMRNRLEDLNDLTILTPAATRPALPLNPSASHQPRHSVSMAPGSPAWIRVSTPIPMRLAFNQST